MTDAKGPPPGLETTLAEQIAKSLETVRERPTDLSQTLLAARALFSFEAKPIADRFGLALGEELGKGGMGSVRLAKQASLDRAVAVKSLIEPDSSGDAAFLLRESKVLGRLEHPNVVPVHGLGWDEHSGPLLVMKRIEGVAWRSEIGPEGGMDRLEYHLEILATVCQALHFAHSRGVIHLDVKPANVMIGGYGEVYLVDWGIAHLMDEPHDPDAPVMGTPAFIAPEMAVRAPVDPRTDVYLLGATLHFILTGQPRHAGRDLQEILWSSVMSSPYCYPPEVPEQLATLCNQACSFRMQDRPEDALAFREKLLEYKRTRGSIAVTAEAQRQLLLAQTDQNDAARHLVAARFGFEQALRDWPQNEQAAQLLRTCLRELALHDIAARNLRGAELVLADLDPPDDELNGMLNALRAKIKRGERAARQLYSLRKDLQLEGHTWGRSVVTLITGVGSSVYILVAGIMARSLGREPPLTGILAFLGIGLISTLIGLYTLRRQLLDNVMYRKLMIAFALTHLLLGIGAYLGIQSGATFHQLIVGVTVVMAAFALLLATVVSSVFWVAEGAAILAGLAIVTWPEYDIEVVALAWGLHGIWIAWALRPSAANEEDDLPPPSTATLP